MVRRHETRVDPVRKRVCMYEAEAAGGRRDMVSVKRRMQNREREVSSVHCQRTRGPSGKRKAVRKKIVKHRGQYPVEPNIEPRWRNEDTAPPSGLN